MEGPFKFLFGSKGRINRAQYWRSLVIFGLAGLFAAAAIAAPIFTVLVILVFIPSLMWGFAIHTERLHDRDKSALCYDAQTSGAETPENQKKPGGRFGHRASEFQEAWNFPTLILISLRLPNLHRQSFT